jgi:hypothetical protein
MSSLHDPAVTPQLCARLDALARYPRRDATPSQCVPVVARVIRFIGVQLRGAFTWATSRALDGADGVNRFFHHLAVMHVRAGQSYRERNAFALDHKMALRALFAAIRRLLPGFFAPPTAGTLEESSDARDQSIRSASPKRLSSTWCNFFQTPAACHSLSRRQQVMPEPQPISGGKYSHGRPVESTKRMPRSTLRFGIRGLPPLGFSGSGGSNGSMTSHSSSVINCFAMRRSLHGKLGFC